MKKRIFALLPALALLVGLAACGGTAQGAWQEQYDLGVLYLSQGDYEEAVQALETAIATDPKRAEAYTQLAEAYLAMDGPEQAAAALERGVTATGDAGLQALLDGLAVAGPSTGPAPEPSPKPTTEPTPSGPRAERLDNEDGSYLIQHYDEAGLLTREEYYSADGMLRQYWLYDYDAEGNMTQAEDYNADGMLMYVRCFDEAGNMTRWERRSTDGALDLYTLYDYDAAGNLTRTEFYNADGTLRQYNLYSYDAEQNLTREEHRNADGTLIDATDY